MGDKCSGNWREHARGLKTVTVAVVGVLQIKYHAERVFSPDVVLGADSKLVSDPGNEVFHLYRHRLRLRVVDRDVLLQRRRRRHAHCLPLTQHILSGWPRHHVIPRHRRPLVASIRFIL